MMSVNYYSAILNGIMINYQLIILMILIPTDKKRDYLILKISKKLRNQINSLRNLFG